jgi:hypothetical protein
MTPVLRRRVPVMYRPGPNQTKPPPILEAASIARCIGAVSSAIPSPSAWKSFSEKRRRAGWAKLSGTCIIAAAAPIWASTLRRVQRGLRTLSARTVELSPNATNDALMFFLNQSGRMSGRPPIPEPAHRSQYDWTCEPLFSVIKTKLLDCRLFCFRLLSLSVART